MTCGYSICSNGAINPSRIPVRLSRPVLADHVEPPAGSSSVLRPAGHARRRRPTLVPHGRAGARLHLIFARLAGGGGSAQTPAACRPDGLEQAVASNRSTAATCGADHALLPATEALHDADHFARWFQRLLKRLRPSGSGRSSRPIETCSATPLPNSGRLLISSADHAHNPRSPAADDHRDDVPEDAPGVGAPVPPGVHADVSFLWHCRLDLQKGPQPILFWQAFWRIR
jgi:hypothetical protein